MENVNILLYYFFSFWLSKSSFLTFIFSVNIFFFIDFFFEIFSAIFFRVLHRKWCGAQLRLCVRISVSKNYGVSKPYNRA